MFRDHDGGLWVGTSEHGIVHIHQRRADVFSASDGISGDYIALVKFINALERNTMFFMVDDLQLGGEQNGSIKLGIRIETYLRST